MAIVERLARLLGLDVQLRSVEGRGSVFAIELPGAVEKAAPAAGTWTDPQAQMRFDGALALLVDDDAEAREAAGGLLAQWGWRVISGAAGAEALAALGEPPVPVNLIISDYRLAHGELGTQVIERVRAACGADVPAILVSGDVAAELREVAHNAGIRVLYKPLQAAKLRSLLHHLLHGSGTEA